MVPGSWGFAVRALILWLSLMFAAVPGQASTAVLTLLEGDAIAIDGARTLAAAAGLRLGPGVIVETSPRATLLRIEWPEGVMLDMGPDTRVMLAPPGFPPRDKGAPVLYLLQGWVKLIGPAGSVHGGLVTPMTDVLPFTGTVVAFTAKGEQQLFAETGKPTVVERLAKGAARVPLGNGELYSARGNEKGTVAARPTPAFIKDMPRSFRDAVPSRAAAFKDKKVEGVTLGEANYASIEHWLVAEPAIRREFPRRFASLAQEPSFRSAIIAKMPAHPEWAGTLGATR